MHNIDILLKPASGAHETEHKTHGYTISIILVSLTHKSIDIISKIIDKPKPRHKTAYYERAMTNETCIRSILYHASY